MAETGKQRQSRIPLDYYKRSDPLARMKVRLAVVAIALAVVYWASGWLRGGDVGRMRYSRGPVASVHATWDTNCTACHDPWTPVDDKSWLAGFIGEPKVTDKKCQECHSGAIHHMTEKSEDTPNCAKCHREHRGRDASLVRMPDQECTVCHAALAAHLAAGGPASQFSPAIKPAIERLSDHPPFRSAAADTGKLKFNHALHLSHGVVVEGAEPNTIEHFVEQLADARDKAEFVTRYAQGQSETSPVQLDCSSCHQLDAGDFAVDPAISHRAGTRSVRAAGQYMSPIKYENQCRLCHPLTYDPTQPAVPHGLEPPELRLILQGGFVKQYLDANLQALNEPIAARPTPGRTKDDVKQAAREEIEESVARAERQLYQGRQVCGECHTFDRGSDDPSDESVLPRSIIPTRVPSVWLEYAKFDHAAHRAVSCLECHSAALASNENSDVLLPQFDVCLECHAPAGGGGKRSGGARHDCVECHRYHNGDAPLHGIGAAARNRTQLRSVQDFVTGSSAHGESSAPATP